MVSSPTHIGRHHLLDGRLTCISRWRVWGVWQQHIGRHHLLDGRLTCISRWRVWGVWQP
jgi:hypothetical protein